MTWTPEASDSPDAEGHGAGWTPTSLRIRPRRPEPPGLERLSTENDRVVHAALWGGVAERGSRWPEHVGQTGPYATPINLPVAADDEDFSARWVHCLCTPAGPTPSGGVATGRDQNNIGLQWMFVDRVAQEHYAQSFNLCLEHSQKLNLMPECQKGPTPFSLRPGPRGSHPLGDTLQGCPDRGVHSSRPRTLTTTSSTTN